MLASPHRLTAGFVSNGCSFDSQKLYLPLRSNSNSSSRKNRKKSSSSSSSTPKAVLYSSGNLPSPPLLKEFGPSEMIYMSLLLLRTHKDKDKDLLRWCKSVSRVSLPSSSNIG